MIYTLTYLLSKKNGNEAECNSQDGEFDTICHLLICIGWGVEHKVEIDTGLLVSAEGWNPEMQRCRRGSLHGSGRSMAAWIINRHLQELERRISLALEDRNEYDTDQDVLQCMTLAIDNKETSVLPMLKRTGEAKSLPLLECIEWYIEEQRLLKGWSVSTQSKLHELTSYLRAYKPQTQLQDIDRGWLCGFLSTLEDYGLRNVTIHKMLEMLRWFVRWAIDEQLMTNDAALHFRPLLKNIPRKVVFLSWQELMRVWHLELEDASPLNEARDLFCLQCFTSLRYSDVSQLRSSQVLADRIELVTRKTAEPLTIELNQYAREILDRHKGRHEPYAMPQMTVQRANLLLKQIGKLAHLDEPIQMVWYVGSQRREEVRTKQELLSTHCGRRTFICCSLAMGIPAETVMRWTGHSNYRSMKPYIAVADDTKRREMSKWDTWGQ